MTYVFCDKTGTLTSNEMQLRQIAIEGTSYGHAEFRCSVRAAACVLVVCPAALASTCWVLTHWHLHCGRSCVLNATVLHAACVQADLAPLQSVV